MAIWKKPISVAHLTEMHQDTAVRHLGIEFLEVGDDFITVYTEVKEVEYAEFMKVISPWEREHLLLHV